MQLHQDRGKMEQGRLLILAVLMLSLLLPLVHCISACSAESPNDTPALKSPHDTSQPPQNDDPQAPHGKTKLPHKVYAHYLCCFDDLGTSEMNPYWWATTCDPWDQSLTSGAVLLADSSAADQQLQGMIDDIRIAKAYGIDGFFVELMEDTPKYRSVWTKLLLAAETVGSFDIGLMVSCLLSFAKVM